MFLDNSYYNEFPNYNQGKVGNFLYIWDYFNQKRKKPPQWSDGFTLDKSRTWRMWLDSHKHIIQNFPTKIKKGGKFWIKKKERRVS